MMTWKIIVLEDDEDLCETLVEVLKRSGYVATGACSGDEALALATRERIDLLVCDVRMAGMDGLQTLEKLRSMHKGLKSIVMTGYAGDDAPVRANRLEASDYLYKPFKLEDLPAAVRRVMEAPAERKGYEKVLGAVVSRFQKLKTAVSEAVISRGLASLESVRDGAFRGFYVAVRSGKLSMEKALHEWDLLTGLEAAREALKEPGGLRLEERQALEDGYRYLVDLNNAMAATDRHFALGRRGDGKMPASDFRPFYERIRGGRISLELLKMAPFLHTVDEFSLAQSTDLKDLHDRVWGHAREGVA